MGHFHVPPDSQPSFWDVFELELWVMPASRPFPLKLLCCEATLEGMAVKHYLLSDGLSVQQYCQLYLPARLNATGSVLYCCVSPCFGRVPRGGRCGRDFLKAVTSLSTAGVAGLESSSGLATA